MINFRGWFIAVSLSSLIQASLAEESWKADVPKAQKAFEKEVGLPLRAGHHIEPTVFPGYYAIRSGNAGKPSAYFREDMIWMGNIRAPGWSIRSTTESSPEGRMRWLKEQVKYLPLERLILVKRSKPPVVVIWSAPDCPFCRRLEEALAQEGVSAYIAPVGLSDEGWRRAAEAYCSTEPAKAWSDAIKGKNLASPSRLACSYPQNMLNDIGFFFGQGRAATPIAVFADGSTISGWDEQHGRVRLREKIAQQIYFPIMETSGTK